MNKGQPKCFNTFHFAIRRILTMKTSLTNNVIKCLFPLIDPLFTLQRAKMRRRHGKGVRDYWSCINSVFDLRFTLYILMVVVCSNSSMS